MPTNTLTGDGDIDRVMQDFSRAIEFLRDWYQPVGPREEFKIYEMAVLGVRYNLCREAELDPRQSQLRPSRRRLRTAIVDQIHAGIQLSRYRKLIQQEFRRVAESFIRIKAARLDATAGEIAKQSQFRATTSVSTGSGRGKGSNFDHVFEELARKLQSEIAL